MNAFRFAAIALAATTLASCDGALGSNQVLHVSSGYIVLPATPDRPAAGYFTVKGGGAPVDLVAVTTNYAQRTEMHQSVRADGMVSMQELLRAPVPAKGQLEFKPGGNHLMVWKINPAAVQAGKLPMVFLFSNNERIQFDLTITEPDTAGAGDASAKGKMGDEHAGH